MNLHRAPSCLPTLGLFPPHHCFSDHALPTPKESGKMPVLPVLTSPWEETSDTLCHGSRGWRMGASISDFSFLPLGAAVASGTCDTQTAGCHSQKLPTRRHLSGVCLFLPPVLWISFVCSGIWGTCTETGASSPSSVPQSVGRGQASHPHCPDSKMGRNLVSGLRS